MQFKKTSLALLSFFAGFVLMTLELTSSRIIAPILGSSVYTWTSVIGITLLGLSAGAFLGGFLADRHTPHTTLWWVLATSTVSITTIVALIPIARAIPSLALGLPLLVLLASLLLFLVPSLLIGMIQPLILKQYALDFSHIGKEYGTLSAVWSIGSILGVFVTGFILVQWIGSIQIIVLLSLLLFIGTIAYTLIFYKKKTTIAFLFVIAILGSFFIFIGTAPAPKTENVVFQKHTAYYDAKVIDFDFEGSPARGLFLDIDSHSVEVESFQERFYTETPLLLEHLIPNPKNILVIGGGAYTIPKKLAALYPETIIEVLEIDPTVTDIAEKYFDLDTFKNIKTTHTDPRVFFEQTETRYDLIFGDAYQSFISVPWHLITHEANIQIHEHLTNAGIYIVGSIGSITGQGNDITKTIASTLTQTFPQTTLMFFHPDRNAVGTTLFFSFKNEPNFQKVFDASLQKTILKYPNTSVWNSFIIEQAELDTLSKHKHLTLTDNHAPTEIAVQSLVNRYFPSYRKWFSDNVSS